MRKSIFGLLLLTYCVAGYGQEHKTSDLFLTLKKQDSIFFQKSFNECDLSYLEEAIDQNLTFYHDQSGIQDREQFFNNVKQNLCSGKGPKPIRKLEKGSLEVFPLFKNGNLYGAIQNGIHHFYLREKGKEDRWTSKAKFTHVWLLEVDVWKLGEVLSYDHSTER